MPPFCILYALFLLIDARILEEIQNTMYLIVTEAKVGVFIASRVLIICGKDF